MDATTESTVEPTNDTVLITGLLTSNRNSDPGPSNTRNQSQTTVSHPYTLRRSERIRSIHDRYQTSLFATDLPRKTQVDTKQLIVMPTDLESTENPSEET